MPIKITHKYLVEGLVFTSYVLFAMAWVGGTASMNNIMASMHIESYASASLLSGAVTIAAIFRVRQSIIPSAWSETSWVP